MNPDTLNATAAQTRAVNTLLQSAGTALRPVSPTSQFNDNYDMNWEKSNGATAPPSCAMDLSTGR